MLGEDWRYRQSQFHEPFRKLRLLGSYFELPVEVRNLADQKFELLKLDPKHRSLHFKKVGRFWSVRVGNTIELSRLMRAVTCDGTG